MVHAQHAETGYFSPYRYVFPSASGMGSHRVRTPDRSFSKAARDAARARNREPGTSALQGSILKTDDHQHGDWRRNGNKMRIFE
jgi:hypothetical protein